MMRLPLLRLSARLGLALLVALSPIEMTDGFGQSSGGYARPSARSSYSSSSSRRPSYGGSGGYSRPSAPSGGYGRPAYGGSSYGGDRAISRRSSSDALRQYRTPPAAPAPGYAPPGTQSSGQSYNSSRRPSSGWGDAGLGTGWGGGRMRASPMAPSYGRAQPGRSFGVWDGLMLWGLLHSLSSPSSARFFQDNRDDPGYRQWRAEADRSAAQDPDVRARLDALDRQMAQNNGSRDGQASAGKPPPLPSANEAASGGSSFVYIVLFLGIVLFLLLYLWRRRRAAAATGSAPAALRGSAASRFRVGMTFPLDPTPFVLAAGATKVVAPEGGGMVSVEAIGVLMDGPVPLNRLYLPGREAFFLLHLGTDGRPDECRYFSRLDEVTPASKEEWAVWLDPSQGMLGWPQFQTKDGRLYDRVWSPGQARIAPRPMTETLQDLSGTTTRKLAVMLYGTATGRPAPAPATEYILVAAVDAPGAAFVEIHAGIDVNPATLSLPSVAL